MGICGGLRKKRGEWWVLNFTASLRKSQWKLPPEVEQTGRWKTSLTDFWQRKLDRLTGLIQQLPDETVVEAVASCQTRGKYPLDATKLGTLRTAVHLGFPVTASRPPYRPTFSVVFLILQLWSWTANLDNLEYTMAQTLNGVSFLFQIYVAR